MKRWLTSPRACFVLAGCLPLVNFVLPLWGIRLYAPQYPEGISMYIWINRITGQLDLVNGLNHYIGMKPLEEAAPVERAVAVPVVLVFGALAVLSGLLHSPWRWLLRWPRCRARATCSFRRRRERHRSRCACVTRRRRPWG